MTARAASSSYGDLAPGAAFAGFRIERLVARGTIGALYAATDPRDGLAVALKVLPLAGEYEGADLDEARERFLQEAKTASGLHHPDIVAVHGAGEAQGRVFIVMELLTGCDLTRYTRPARLLPEPVALRIAARVAEALAYAHGLGVVHRDVKPANVMVDLARHQMKLTDFGIARLDDGLRSRSGVMMGTPSFMAPEQLAGGRVDGRADLYALGVMLFQLLTGRLPYEAASMGQLLMQIARAAPLALDSLRPDLPARLSGLVAALLQKHPAERPGDGRTVGETLRDIADGWPGPAPLVSGSQAQPVAPDAAGVPGHNATRP
ncbi:MAG: serine/threonine-protein kinase [Pseudomonadota bacterium]